jgi:hypothetical protein
MDVFLVRLFPKVYARKHRAKENNYCKFDDQRLQLFTSSLYLAALAASFRASLVSMRFGLKCTMQSASIFFLIGVRLCVGAINIFMLNIGRISLGIGVRLQEPGGTTFPL